MARVHLARNVELDRLEAVKILRRERATEEEPRLRFEGWVATVVKEGERFAWTPVPDGPRSTWRLRISFLEGGHT